MKAELIEVGGLKGALLSKRLPMCKDLEEAKEKCGSWYLNDVISEDNKKLCKQLINGDMKAGSFGQPNSKFLRMIHAQICITAPLYFWKEADTYKIGTTANSTSTMHRLANYPITKECFEMEDYQVTGLNDSLWDSIIENCEKLRQSYNETKDKLLWKEIIRLLPESWLQTRMFDVDYQTLRNIYHWRKNHKLTEWQWLCSWIKENIPYADILICDEE